MVKRAFVLARTTLIRHDFIPQDTAGRALYTPLDDAKLGELLSLADKEGSFRERGGEHNVENDPSVQQLNLYGYVQLADGRFMLYQRGAEGYTEKRLRGRISLGLGGHMELVDRSLMDAFYRELNEETIVSVADKPIDFGRPAETNISLMQRYIAIEPKGLIKDERDEVGAVHLGIACRLTLKGLSTSIAIRSDAGENIRSFFVTPEEYVRLRDTKEIIPEGWTDIIFENELKAR